MNKKKDSSQEYKWDKKLSKYVPKASPLGFTLFVNERRVAMHKEMQNAEKKLSVKQIARKIRSEWLHMEENDKKKYQAIVDKEKKRAEKQKKEMEDKGFFTLSNGTKSSDLPPPETTSGKQRSSTPMKLDTKKVMPKKK